MAQSTLASIKTFFFFFLETHNLFLETAGTSSFFRGWETREAGMVWCQIQI